MKPKHHVKFHKLMQQIGQEELKLGGTEVGVLYCTMTYQPCKEGRPHGDNKHLLSYSEIVMDENRRLGLARAAAMSRAVIEGGDLEEWEIRRKSKPTPPKGKIVTAWGSWNG